MIPAVDAHGLKCESSEDGFRIKSIDKGKAAYRAGLRVSDVIVEIDGHLTKNMMQHKFTSLIQTRSTALPCKVSRAQQHQAGAPAVHAQGQASAAHSRLTQESSSAELNSQGRGKKRAQLPEVTGDQAEQCKRSRQGGEGVTAVTRPGIFLL